MGDDPGSGKATSVSLDISGLPWGAVPFTADRYEVSDATFKAGEGVKLVNTSAGSGGTFSDTVEFGSARLILWELTKQ